MVGLIIVGILIILELLFKPRLEITTQGDYLIFYGKVENKRKYFVLWEN